MTDDTKQTMAKGKGSSSGSKWNLIDVATRCTDLNYQKFNIQPYYNQNETRFVRVHTKDILFDQEPCIMVVINDITNLIEKENISQQFENLKDQSAILSHELKTPLEIINQESSALSKANQNKETKRGLRNISIASSFAGNFVHNLIELSQISCNIF